MKNIARKFAVFLLAGATTLAQPAIGHSEEEAQDSALSPRQKEQLDSLHGSAQVVDGKVVGLFFAANEKFVVGGPNEVILPAVTDETLVIVKSFPHLKTLCIEDAQVTDRGMLHVGTLAGLEELVLSRTSVTEDGLKHFRELKHLRRFELPGLKFSANGLRTLTINMALAETLHDLNLRSCTFEDPSLAVLTSFPALRRLWLSNTNVSDDAVDHLKQLKNLKELHVNSTHMSESGFAALRRALPNARVVSEDPPP